MSRPGFNCEPQEAPKPRVVLRPGSDGLWYVYHYQAGHQVAFDWQRLPFRTCDVPPDVILRLATTVNPTATVEVES